MQMQVASAWSDLFSAGALAAAPVLAASALDGNGHLLTAAVALAGLGFLHLRIDPAVIRGPVHPVT